MKKILLLGLMLTLLVGCSKANTTVDKAKEELKEIEEIVLKDVEKVEEYSKEKTTEAISYIHENYDKMKDKDVAKKIYEYGVYLENIAKKSTDATTHEISLLAKEASKQAYKIFTEGEDLVEKNVLASIDALKQQVEYLKQDTKNFVEEFHQLLSK